MVKSLETQAYNDLIKHYWNDSAGNFSFSINEKISSPAITSICVMAINNYENPKGIWLKSNKIKIEKYLEDSYPWKDAGKHYQNNMAMAFGFLGLKTIGSRNKKMMDETIEYLKFEQNSDGGWFFKKEIDSNSHPYFTYWVLRCFLTLEPSDLLWLEVIAPAYNNLLESIKTNYMNPTTYCMVRHILHLVYETYEEFLDDSLRQEYRNLREYKVERFQNKNGSWKQEPTVISSAYFRKSLFTISSVPLKIE